MMNNAYSAYRNTSIQTAPPERLLIMLYDGLIQALGLASNALEQGDVKVVNDQLIKAQNIVFEGLLGQLDMSYEVSQHLSAVYDYWYRRLVQANVDKDVSPITEVMTQVREFRETWSDAIVKAKTEAQTPVVSE